jgi:thiamine biosynthesis protein ThiS
VGLHIQLQVNGEAREVPEGTSVLSLLKLLDIKAPRVAVEVNAQVITRTLHETTVLASGDQVEIVTFVGGG